MPVVRKTFGEYPMKTVVNTTEVHFDAEGLAEVEQDIFDALITVPGFEAHGVEEEGSGDEGGDEPGGDSSEGNTEDSSEEEEVPSKPVRKRPSMKK